MITHEFKGGTGTASRRLPDRFGGWTVGVLVQSNYGERGRLRCGGAPVGREFGYDRTPPPDPANPRDLTGRDAGSIIVVVATDAPLLPIQCRRLAQRATVGVSWVGGYGANSSGDIFVAFSTANFVTSAMTETQVRMLGPESCTPLFAAVAEATEEAIWNALVSAETMTGYAGRTAHAIPHDALVESVAAWRRGR
jgi:D-aminopeptidase